MKYQVLFEHPCLQMKRYFCSTLMLSAWWVMTSLVLCKGLAWNIYKVSNIQSITKGLFIITFHNFVLA